MARKKVEISIVQDSRPYILWARVSTANQGADGLGIAAQKTIAKTFMGREPVAVFTDVYSGTKLKQCVGLWQAIELCKKENYLLVVARVDRCRNVQEALEIVDAVGERNLVFCDSPSADRFVLTILFAVAEKQAMCGRINTKVALAERKRQIKEQGGFFSKAGRWTTHLGQKKGADLSAAYTASGIRTTNMARDWRSTSPLYIWVENQVYKRRPRKDILAEAAQLYEKNPEQYGTREGKPLSQPILSKWVKEIQSNA